MSSILDALKKLEEEKAARASKPEEAPPYEPATAGAVLFGKAPGEPRGMQISPMTLVAGGGIFAVIVVGVAIATAVYITRPNAGPNTLAQNTAPIVTPAAPVPEPVTPSPDPAEAEAPQTEATSPALEEAQADPEPAAPIQVAAATPAPSNPAPPKPAPVTPKPAPAEPAPAPAQPAPAQPANVQPAPAQPTPQPAASDPPPSREPLPSDLTSLPPLRISDEVRYGLEGIKISMIAPPGPGHPYGQAFINLNRVYVQEQIPGTRARLIGIDPNLQGIAIEIIGTGQRFFVEHGRSG